MLCTVWPKNVYVLTKSDFGVINNPDTVIELSCGSTSFLSLFCLFLIDKNAQIHSYSNWIDLPYKNRHFTTVTAPIYYVLNVASTYFVSSDFLLSNFLIVLVKCKSYLWINVEGSMLVRGCQIGMQGPQLCAGPRHFFKLDVPSSRLAFLDLKLHVLQLGTSNSNNWGRTVVQNCTSDTP